MAIIGNTVTLKAEFPSSIGDLSLLTNVTVKVYTENLKILLANIIPTKISNGLYEANYTVQPNGMPSILIYEFSGMINGYVYLGRGQIPRSYL